MRLVADGGSVVLGLVFWAVLIAVYWLPTVIAARRHHRNAAMIAVIDGLLGWTFIGWVVALALSVGNPSPSQPPVVQHIHTGAAPTEPK